MTTLTYREVQVLLLATDILVFVLSTAVRRNFTDNARAKLELLNVNED